MKTLLIGMAASLIAGSASAAQIQNVVFDINPTLGSAGVLNVAMFNTNLGALLSATYNVTGTVSASGVFTNNDENDLISATVTLTSGIEATGPDSLALIGGSSFGSPASSAATLDDVAFGSPAPYSIFATVNDTGSFTNFGDVSAAGGGMFAINYVFNGNVGASGGGTAGSLTFATVSNLQGTVTYEYERPENVIPLPAALPLLAGALGLLGVARLRRKA